MGGSGTQGDSMLNRSRWSVSSRALLCLAFAAPALAQNVWIVDAGAGAGTHFADLPTAVASPNVLDGDVIVVRTGPFGEGAVGFTTSKGLTILGEGGQVPVYTTAQSPIEVQALPAGRAFRLVGFRRSTDGPLHLRAIQCAGSVHFEDLHAREPDLFFPTTPSVAIHGSAAVTLRDVETFGAPAVEILNSTATLVSCRLGITSIGLGGGRCVVANGSAVAIVQPRFEPVFGTAIELSNCDVVITGGSGSVIHGPIIGATSSPIVGNGGSLTIDPSVTFVTQPPGAPVVSGSLQAITALQPCTWLSAPAAAGQSTSLLATGAPGSLQILVVGLPGMLTVTPLGWIGIDLAFPVAWGVTALVPGTGVVVYPLALAPSLPAGLAFTSQVVAVAGSSIALGLPVTAVVR